MFESGKEQPGNPYSEIAKKVFLNFEARSNDPGEFLTNEEKEKLQAATRMNMDALKKWDEHRNSKYRVNSLYAPILASEMFLKSKEAELIESKLKEKLIERISGAYSDLESFGGKEISKVLVDEVEGIIKEVKKYLK